MKSSIVLLLAVVQFAFDLPDVVCGDDSTPPNIVVVVADDLGYRDLGCYGCVDFETPNIDNLANSGIRFTNGYVTHPYCSPSRAGILTGKYQQRFGHEHNPRYNEANHEIGIDTKTELLPSLLQKHGYSTCVIGKWHLGAGQPFRPNQRGFDEFYGFLGGGHDYFRVRTGGSEYDSPLWKNGEKTGDTLTYLTDDLTAKAESFIESQSGNPYCLFVMYNAPHAPDQVTEKYLSKVSDIPHQARRKYAALVQGVDHGVGRIVEQINRHETADNTFIVFISDNGGRRGSSDNRPLRGNKGLASRRRNPRPLYRQIAQATKRWNRIQTTGSGAGHLADVDGHCQYRNSARCRRSRLDALPNW